MDNEEKKRIELYYSSSMKFFLVCFITLLVCCLIYIWKDIKDQPYIEYALIFCGLVIVLGIGELQFFYVIINDTQLIKKSIFGVKIYNLSDIKSYEIRKVQNKSSSSYTLYLFDKNGKSVLKAIDILENWQLVIDWAKKN